MSVFLAVILNFAFGCLHFDTGTPRRDLVRLRGQNVVSFVGAPKDVAISKFYSELKGYRNIAVRIMDSGIPAFRKQQASRHRLLGRQFQRNQGRAVMAVHVRGVSQSDNEGAALQRDGFRGSLPEVLYLQVEPIDWLIGIAEPYTLYSNISSQLSFCCITGMSKSGVGNPHTRFGFVKSSFNQPNANSAESHADHSRNAHDFRPPSRDILGGKILLFALTFACGFLCLARAIYLSESGRGKTSFFHVCLGVTLIFYGGVGGGMAIG